MYVYVCTYVIPIVFGHLISGDQGLNSFLPSSLRSHIMWMVSGRVLELLVQTILGHTTKMQCQSKNCGVLMNVEFLIETSITQFIR